MLLRKTTLARRAMVLILEAVLVIRLRWLAVSALWLISISISIPSASAASAASAASTAVSTAPTIPAIPATSTIPATG